MSLDEKFNKAAADVKNSKTKYSDVDLLEFFALYQQATVGDINIDHPGDADVAAKGKWEAWNRKKGLSKDEAKKQYIAKAQ